jgi:hypothetical protein
MVNATLRPLYPRERDPVPIAEETGGGGQGRSGRVRKISPPPGFDPRTLQPVASRCEDCVITVPGMPVSMLLVLIFVVICLFIYFVLNITFIYALSLVVTETRLPDGRSGVRIPVRARNFVFFTRSKQ